MYPEKFEEKTGSDAFQTMGLRGYLFYVTGDFEVAFQNWSSKEDMERAFKSEFGQAVANGAAAVLDGILFEQMQDVDWINQLQ